MKDEFNERPELPAPSRQDMVIKNVPSSTVWLLEGWLKEEAQKERYRTPTDIFTEKISELLYRELGEDGVRERFKQYQDEQSSRTREYLKYCKKEGIDPDSDPALNQ